MNVTEPKTIFTIALIALGAALIALVISISNLSSTKKILRGSTKELGTSMVQVIEDMKNLDTWKKSLEEYLRSVENRLKSSTRGVYTLRFNPFQGDGSGGFQSFATAFVNEEGDGVIISSLHARDRMSVFAKPISKFTSELTLTEEEQEALSKAKESCKL
jgi:Protein of unknown function (DUF4446)